MFVNDVVWGDYPNLDSTSHWNHRWRWLDGESRMSIGIIDEDD